MVRQKQLYGIIVLMLLVPCMVYGENSLSVLKTDIAYRQTDFDISGIQMRFRKKSDGVAMEYNKEFSNGIIVGAELHYTRWYLLDNGFLYSGYANSYQWMGLSKYKLFPQHKFSPYIGVSSGYHVFSVHSSNSASLSGMVHHVVAGIEYRPVSKVGFLMNYKYSFTAVDDATHNDIQTHFSSLGASVKIYFLREQKNESPWDNF